LIELEMAQIFQHDGWHRHTKRREVILGGHFFLFRRIHQKTSQAVGKIFRASWFVKLDGELFSIRHLAKIGEIGTNNRHTISASKMRDPATTGRGRIGHNRHARALEQCRQCFFRHVSGELDFRISLALFSH
jgi:hypothetical protein